MGSDLESELRRARREGTRTALHAHAAHFLLFSHHLFSPLSPSLLLSPLLSRELSSPPLTPAESIAGDQRRPHDIRANEITPLLLHGDLHLHAEGAPRGQADEQRIGEFHHLTGKRIAAQCAIWYPRPLLFKTVHLDNSNMQCEE